MKLVLLKILVIGGCISWTIFAQMPQYPRVFVKGSIRFEQLDDDRYKLNVPATYSFLSFVVDNKFPLPSMQVKLGTLIKVMDSVYETADELEELQHDDAIIFHEQKNLLTIHKYGYESDDSEGED